jgi:hypothetical protein
VEWPDELLIRLERSEISGRLVTRLEIDGDYVLEMEVVPSDDRSAISVGAWQELLDRQLIPRSASADHCPLRSLQLRGQSIPDLDVEIDPRLQGIGGVMGADVLENYEYHGYDRGLSGYILRK